MAGQAGKYIGINITPHSGHYMNGATAAQNDLADSITRGSFEQFGVSFPRN